MENLNIKIIKKLENNTTVLYITLPDIIHKAIDFQTQKNNLTEYSSNYCNGMRRKVCNVIHSITTHEERTIFDNEFLITGRLVLKNNCDLSVFNSDFKSVLAKLLYNYNKNKDRMRRMTSLQMKKAGVKIV